MRKSDRDMLLGFLGGRWSAEHLPVPGDLGAWLTDHGLLDEDVEITAVDLKEAHRLRSGLLAFLASDKEGPRVEEASLALDRVAQTLPLCVTAAGPSGLKLRPAGRGVQAALARILALAYRLSAEGEFARFKTCHGCGHAFYDKSKNRSAVWCTMARCGSQEKSRAYRARKRTPLGA